LFASCRRKAPDALWPPSHGTPCGKEESTI
jgi:hypothetical protein